MKKYLTGCLLIALALAAFCGFPAASAFADVGNQNDYGGGGSDNGSSWGSDSSSDWSSSSSSGSYDSHSLSSGGGGTLLSNIVTLIVFGGLSALVFVATARAKRRRSALFAGASDLPATSSGANPQSRANVAEAFTDAQNNESAVIAQIKKHDPLFSEQAFEGWVKEVFLTVNEAWTERDIDRIRPLETTALFSEHSRLLKKYLVDQQINKIDRLGILGVHTAKFTIDADFEYLQVMLKAQMIDYVIHEDTNEVIAGDKSKVIQMIYTIDFARAAGTPSTEDPSNIRTTDCPSCGAPIQISAGGRCEYCRSVLETNKHGWVMCSYTGKRA